MTNQTFTASAPSPLWQYWRGLSGWNFYFLVKFGLLWAGYLNFHPLLNLVFMAFLLMPLPKLSMQLLRHWLAIPHGVDRKSSSLNSSYYPISYEVFVVKKKN